LLQLPLQALSQQTLVVAPVEVGAQWPLPHSASEEQAALIERALHCPLTQAGIAVGQSVSAQQLGTALRVQTCVPGQLR
jgi:hypothetical protein